MRNTGIKMEAQDDEADVHSVSLTVLFCQLGAAADSFVMPCTLRLVNSNRPQA